MWIRKRRGWELKESALTPESVFGNRRRFLAGAAGAIFAPALLACEKKAAAEGDATPDPSTGLYPVQRNPRYALDRDMTAEGDATSYNNYYEFGTSKDVVAAAQALPIRPWAITIDGMVGKPQTIAIDDLLKQMPLEERAYRHRCVEAWSMAVPWSGFPLSALVALAEPQAGAKFVRFESFMNTQAAPGQTDPLYPWPYVEGLTLAEATNELAFIATGIYGKPLPKQNGAPFRLAVPWKYGFKSAKGIQRITFTDIEPTGLWQLLQSSEYGFYANVNPAFPHPRWSQESERLLGSGERVPTQIFNGYGEFVAGLYPDLNDRNYFY
ncbi:protein-methionine-sulfoxide reductase catalytic subunit MsrP [Dongia sp.]|uniref:protein-methionine-sulfoxide reductase catalytic subunit MsrP n=1 Tax=Dongia sp. TaxID=1977262 RepID=UPI0035AFBDFB